MEQRSKAISREAALELIKPATYLSGKCCLAEELGISVVNKEYGDDDDWVEVWSEDYETIRDYEEYCTFEIWW